MKAVFVVRSRSRVFPGNFLRVLPTELVFAFILYVEKSCEERSHMIQQSRLISQSREQVSAINVIGGSVDFCASWRAWRYAKATQLLRLGRTFGRVDYYRCVFQPLWTAARHVANMYWNSRCGPSSRARDMSWTRDSNLLRGRTPTRSSERDFRGEHDNVGNIQGVPLRWHKMIVSLVSSSELLKFLSSR